MFKGCVLVSGGWCYHMVRGVSPSFRGLEPLWLRVVMYL